MTPTSYKGKWNHVEWLDLTNNGVLSECVIMKRFGNQDVAFFQTSGLDSIDRHRIVDILKNRNAAQYELWDMMSGVTLGNGVNALEYFQQFTKILTNNGQIIPMTMGRVGAPGQVSAPKVDPIAQASTEDFGGRQAPPVGAAARNAAKRSA